LPSAGQLAASSVLAGPVATPEHPICPICEMEVDMTSPHETYRGRTYYSCSKHHQEVFDTARDRFAGGLP